MRVLFVQKSLGQAMLGPMYLSRALKNAGHETRALLLPTESNLVDEVRNYAPDVLCYGTTTGLHRYYLQVNRLIKARHPVMTVFGGMHATFMPQAMIRDEHVDAVCVGEGEPALVELVNRLERGESVRDVQNFHIKVDGEVVANPVRPLVQDLDSLGFPDHELIFSNPLYGNSKHKTFITSRGCVARCHYCFHSGFGRTYDDLPGKYLRRRSVDHVLAEIEEVRGRWPMEFVHFTDDMFNFDRRWQEEFLRAYRDRIGLPFSAIFMIDGLDPELLRLYREAGCANIRIAFETASDDLKKDLNRFHGSPSTNQLRAARMIQDAGIRLTTLNMVGIPGGTLENEFNTLRMNIMAAPGQVLVNFIHPYPGTSIDSKGIPHKPYDEFDLSATRFSPFDLPDKLRIENLHHLFPLVVRFPFLMAVLPALIRVRFMPVRKLYLAFFGLCMDWQYAELIHCTKSRLRRVAAVTAELASRLVYRVRSGVREAIFDARTFQHP